MTINSSFLSPSGSIGDLQQTRNKKKFVTCVDCGAQTKARAMARRCKPCSSEHSESEHRRLNKLRYHQLKQERASNVSL